VTMGHKYTRYEREGGMIDAYLHIFANKVLFSKASVERASQKFKDTCTR
jgi:hypothetical protein